MNDKGLTVEFVNPFYTDAVRDYVAVPYPTGEVVRLWSEDGTLITEADDPRDRWPALLAMQASAAGHEVTEADVEWADTFESHEELACAS